MSSGIAVEDNCLEAFQDLKLRKKHRYIVYKLSDDNKAIIVGKAVGKEATFDQFTKELPDDDCRYAVYDFEFEKSAEEGLRSKICFVVWSPETAKIKQKMLYASSKDALRKKLVGIAHEIQATDPSEITFETVLEKVKSF